MPDDVATAVGDVVGGRWTRSVLVLCLAQFVLAVDQTVVTVANPDIQRGLHIAAEDLHWTTNAFGVTFGGLLLLGGRLADRFGPHRLFMWGMALFTVSSVAAAGAQTGGELLLARAVQGLGAAAVAPASLALLVGLSRDEKRSRRAMGYWAAAGSTGGMAGFVLGGLLDSLGSWRWIFILVVPFGLLAVIGVQTLLRETAEASPQKVDLVGGLVITAASALLVFASAQMSVGGLASARLVVSVVGAALLLAAFVLMQSRVEVPLAPWRRLRGTAWVANAVSALHNTAVAGTLFLGAISLQAVSGFSPATAGAALLPLPVAYTITANISAARRKLPKPRRRVVWSSLTVACGLVWLAWRHASGDFATGFFVGEVIIGLGLGAAQIPLLQTATGSVAAEDRGVVSGLYTMCQRVGGSLGLAVLAASAAGGAARATAPTSHGLSRGFVVAAVAVLLSGVLAFALPRSAHGGHLSSGSEETFEIAALMPPAAASAAVVTALPGSVVADLSAERAAAEVAADGTE